MGNPKFSRRKYETPSHPWQEDRIKAENELTKKYGLKNKREIWKGETSLRNYRGNARGLLAKIGSDDPQIKKESNQLLTHLTRLNILPLNSTLDDVLALKTEALLSRRLQTLTYLRGFANTPNQARQLISHGHIAIADRKVTVPGYMVTKDEEKDIGYVAGSPLNDTMHPARPSSDFKSDIVKKIEEEQKSKDTDKPKPNVEKKKSTEIEKADKSDKASKKSEDKTKPDTITTLKKVTIKDSPNEELKEEKPIKETNKLKKEKTKETKPETKKESATGKHKPREGLVIKEDDKQENKDEKKLDGKKGGK